MSNNLLKISQFFSEYHQLTLSKEDLYNIKEIVLTSSKPHLQEIEEGLCKTQRDNCVKTISEALDNYYHPGMHLEEIQKIVGNVVTNKAETPNVTDTVRFLIVGS